MFNAKLRRSAPIMALVLVSPALLEGMSIREYRKLSAETQAVFLSAAVSMAAYTSAAGGDVATASCIKKWFFGHEGDDTPGPREIAVEIAVAERRDPDRYQVEGIILGTLQEACPSNAHKH